MRRFCRLPALLACTAVTTLAMAAGASASTLIVTSRDDADDGTCDARHCSLREAIHAANANAGEDEILSNDDEPITPTTELPAITDTVHITASRLGRCNVDSAPFRLSGKGADFSGLVFAPGSDGSNVCLINVGGFRTGIELHSDVNRIMLSTIGTTSDGTSDQPNDVAGIHITGDTNIIGGSFGGQRNIISGNGLHGVLVDEGDTNVIVGNLIGTDSLGIANIGNGTGVTVEEEATGTQVGGVAPEFGNVISGNDAFGVEAAGGSIVGNMIGTDRAGTSPVPNNEAGVHAIGPVRIGGRTASRRNVISGHDTDLILDGPAIVEGNLIGPDADGTPLVDPLPVSGRERGILVLPGGGDAVIGGTEAGAGNVIGGQLAGIESRGRGGGFRVEGNLIGLAPDGTSPLDTEVGVLIGEDTSGARIGGTDDGEGNIVGADFQAISTFGDETRIEGNTIGLDRAGDARDELGDALDERFGVVVQATAEHTRVAANTISGLPTGVDLRANSVDTLVENNAVGTDADATAARPNLAGVVIGEGAEARIAGNVLSANVEAGVFSDARTADALVEDNDIGPAGDGTPLGNGIGLELGRPEGAAPGAGDGFVIRGNRIAHNARDGVVVLDTAGGVAIEGNEIHDNGDLGIDFGDDGVSANGLHDAAVLPGFPVLTNVADAPTGTTVQGTIDLPIGHQIRIELFASPTCDGSAHGEGRTPLGTLTTTGSGGPAAFSALVAGRPGDQRVVTATATDLDTGRTSEFSRCATGETDLPPVADDPPDEPPPGPGPGGDPPPSGPVVAGPGPIGLPPVIDPPPTIECEVPKLAGLTLAKAKKRLRAAGCGIGKITRPKKRPRGEGFKLVVKKASQPPGTVRAEGTRIRLTLKYVPKPRR